MKGYPKRIAVVQDFKNLLAIPGFKDRVLIDLIDIYNLNDSKSTRSTTLIDPSDPESGWNTEIIDNPMPTWKLKGFVNRQEVAELVTENGGEV